MVYISFEEEREREKSKPNSLGDNMLNLSFFFRLTIINSLIFLAHLILFLKCLKQFVVFVVIFVLVLSFDFMLIVVM